MKILRQCKTVITFCNVYLISKTILIQLISIAPVQLAVSALTAIYYVIIPAIRLVEILRTFPFNSIWRNTPREWQWMRSCECAIKITNLSCIFECINRSNASEVQRDLPHFMHAWTSARLTCPHWRWFPSRICAPSVVGRPPKTVIRAISCFGTRYSYRDCGWNINVWSSKESLRNP